MADVSESYLVFSDVHLGSDLDDHQGNTPRRSQSVDEDLVALLDHYRDVPPRADRWHIVIAGDFIDFIGMSIGAPDAIVTPLNDEEEAHGLGSAADHAREKLRRVGERHPDVFAALASFVADGHALTIVHGNHDIELHWDEVKDDLRAVLLRHARAGRDLDPEAFLSRIAFNPWFFWRDGVAFIEHGHQYDPFCSTEHVMAPLSPLDPRRVVHGFCEVLLRYVVRPTRGMSESGHEHVGLGHYVRFGIGLGARGMVALGVRFMVAVRTLFRLRAASLSAGAAALRAEHEKRITQLATASRIGIERLRRLLALQARPITSTISGILGSLLLDRLALGGTTLLGGALVAAGAWSFGLSPLWALALLPLWWLLDRRFMKARSVDPGAQMAERAAHLARLFPAAFVVMGHTHTPVTASAGDATYINVGSWAEHDDASEPAARTHLVIHVGPRGPEADFRVWGPTGPISRS